MSKPDIEPKQTVSGIAVDPRTLDRVIPESKRRDGTLRKQIKIRPGYTPQEDVSRFRGTRQRQMDQIQLPQGHILGWVAPSAETNAGAKKKTVGSAGEGGDRPATKSAAKNAKRKAKKQAVKEKVIQENWEDSDEETPKDAAMNDTSNKQVDNVNVVVESTESQKDTTSDTQAVSEAEETVDALTKEVENLKVQ
ncbi:hypothetical protein EW145_g52 [Phellinidium pouzarii]|uniref:WIBG Mago-binding domain-containing protein n=1 Tax=Phellinidium pouzarii TaxID=167371 RepID=A0A4V3XE54_9AGAM|nr:hypothetical protein EW145_g52 [Phellinidium pouzarii]